MIIPGYNHDRPVEVKEPRASDQRQSLDVFFNDHKIAKKWEHDTSIVLVKVEK
jgi:hypothetical protein